MKINEFRQAKSELHIEVMLSANSTLFCLEYEGSGTEVQRKHSKCGVCKYRAECDEDAENVG